MMKYYIILIAVLILGKYTKAYDSRPGKIVSSVTYATLPPGTTAAPATTAAPTNTTQVAPQIDPRNPLTNPPNTPLKLEVAPGDDNTRSKRQTPNCGCFPSQTCNNNGSTSAPAIDPRIVATMNSTCASDQSYCCINSNSSAQISCGARFTGSASVTLQPGMARYGDFPWMALIQNSADGSYVGGGIIIDVNNVLTAAHKVARFANGTGLRIRLGEWDMSSTAEQYPYRDFTVSRFWIHENFNAATLQNDVALIRLSASITVNPFAGMSPICMPSSGQLFEGQRCWVSGWGVDQFTNGRMQTILRAVDVPVVTQTFCETSLRSTRLGSAWTLDRSSFICAGGEANKDSCTGDGGSGLVCEVTTGRWVLAGLVAWGIGCASNNVTAAYVNVVNYLPWILPKLNG